MRILVIFTGGTIGSSLNNGWISTNSNTKRYLIDNYIKQSSQDITFFEKEPYTILSENLCAENINTLLYAVEESLSENYDGIIITHGTDTIQYTAAALRYAFGNTSIPVILVSSNYPLYDERANGHSNFAAAVDFICSNKAKGIYVAYKNKNSAALFHDPVRLHNHPENDDALYSMRPFAESKNGEVNILAEENENPLALGIFSLIKSPQILTIFSCPGDSFSYSPEKYNAIIIKPYHSGTLNTANESFIEFCKEAKSKNVPIFVVNIPDGNLYESSKEFNKLGIIPIVSSAFPSVYTRLWIAISRNENLYEQKF